MRLFGLFIQLLLLLVAEAQDFQLGKWHYDKAVEFYKREECVNASLHAREALRIFRSIGNEDWIKQAENLLGTISGCLRTQAVRLEQKARELAEECRTLNLAEQWFEARQRCSDSLVAINEALMRLKHVYPTPPAEWLDICEELRRIIEKRLREAELGVARVMMEGGKDEFWRGDDYVSKLMEHRNPWELHEPQPYYSNALSKLEEAARLYEKHNLTDKAESCKGLVGKVREKINSLELTASGLLDGARLSFTKAERLFEEGAYEEAFNNYFESLRGCERTKRIYAVIGSEEGLRDVKLLLETVRRGKEKREVELMRSVDELVDEGETLLLQGRRETCEEAIRKFKAAIAELGILREMAHILGEKEKALRLEERAKRVRSEYLTRAEECILRVGELRVAEELLKEAGRLLEEGRVAEALAKAEEAHGIFEKYANLEGLVRARDLLKRIRAVQAELETADTAMDRASKLLVAGSFDEALAAIEEARGIYEKHKALEQLKRCDELRAKVERTKRLNTEVEVGLRRVEELLHSPMLCEEEVRRVEMLIHALEELGVKGLETQRRRLEELREPCKLVLRSLKELAALRKVSFAATIFLTLAFIVGKWLCDYRKERAQRRFG